MRDNVSALIIGTGAATFVASLKEMARDLGVAEKVRFLGYREDAYGVVKACDLMAMPSLWEGLPVAALEGMACEVPVLLSDIPPHRELIDHGRDGWLFRSCDERSLADGILAILGDSETGRKVAQAGARKVLERYDSARMAESYERLYEECIRREFPEGKAQ